MSIAALRYFYPDNDQTQRLYQNLTDWADQVTADTILGGKVVTGVRFIKADTDVAVPHGLGKTPDGTQTVRLQSLPKGTDTDGSTGVSAGAAIIYESPNQNKIPDKVSLLRATAPTLASLRFF